ncbi:unnamed protein product, partial [Heterosigma akashiwo]
QQPQAQPQDPEGGRDAGDQGAVLRADDPVRPAREQPPGHRAALPRDLRHPQRKADPEKADALLAPRALLVLAPQQRQADMLERVKRLGRPLERVPDFQEAARRFTTPELIR